MISKQYAIDVPAQTSRGSIIRQLSVFAACGAHLDELKLDPCVTYVVGENGSGKSTLLEAIAVGGFNPEGGTKNFNFATRTSQSTLHEYLRIAKGVRKPRDGFFLRAESFFNVATEIERLDAEASWAARHRLVRRQVAPRAVARRVVPRAGEASLRRQRPVHPRRAGGRAVAQRQLAALARIHS